MNILYAIDEGNKDYSRYLGVSILSPLEKNKYDRVVGFILLDRLGLVPLFAKFRCFGNK